MNRHLNVLIAALGIGLLIAAQAHGQLFRHGGKAPAACVRPCPPPCPPPVPCPPPCPPDMRVASVMCYPTGEECSSILKLTRYAPKDVRLGVPFSYQIVVQNLTCAPIPGVLVSEQFPQGLEVKAVTPAPQSQAAASAQWSIATLPPKAAQIIEVNGIAKTLGAITGCVTVTLQAQLCQPINVVQPKLELTKTMPSEVILCDPIPVKLVVKNSGTGVACDVKITDKLPEGLQTPDGKKVIEFLVGALGSGEAREVGFVAVADRTGVLVNNAVAGEPGGSTASASAQVVVRLPVLNVSISNPPFQYLGRDATFNLTVTNTGDAEARDTVLCTNVPPNTGLVAVTEGAQIVGAAVSWPLGTLPPGGSRTVAMTVKCCQIGLAPIAAVAKAYCAEAQGASQLEIKGIPAILLEVIDVNDPVEVGGQESYLIRVTNQGSLQGTNIVIECTLAEEMDAVSATGPAKAAFAGKTITFEPLLALAPAGRVEYTVVAKGLKAGDARFRVKLTSAETTSPVEESESTHLY